MRPGLWWSSLCVVVVTVSVALNLFVWQPAKMPLLGVVLAGYAVGTIGYFIWDRFVPMKTRRSWR